MVDGKEIEHLGGMYRHALEFYKIWLQELENA